MLSYLIGAAGVYLSTTFLWIVGGGIADRLIDGDEYMVDIIAPPGPYVSYEKTPEQIDYLCRVRREAKMKGEGIC